MAQYPWYEVVEGHHLEQGDLLRALPIPTPIPELGGLDTDEPTIDVDTYDVVVMTQSCDLVQDKIPDVILCPHWDLATAGRVDSALQQKGAAKEIIGGRRHRYLMLDRSPMHEVPMALRIVDFGRVFCLPKAFVRMHAQSLGKRLRLCPPYREHLAQGFARFFMRVGLPQDIKLDPTDA